MAGKVRHLLVRDGRYFARMGVPEILRSVIGKRELLTPLGPDRRTALDTLPAAVAEMKATLAAARQGKAPAPRPGKLLTIRQIAAEHYRAELAIDDAERNHPSLATDTAKWARDAHREALRRVASGKAADDEAEAIIGWAVDGWAEHQPSPPERGTPEWRSTARMLAQIQLETVARKAERDEGDFSGKPSLPILTAPEPAPAPVDPIEARAIHADSKRPIAELLPRYLKERGVSTSVNGEYAVAVRMLDEFLGGDVPVHRIIRRDLTGFKNALLDAPVHYTKRFPGKTMAEAIVANKARKEPFPTMAAQTINAKWLSRLNALFSWMVANEIIPDNPVAGVRVDAKRTDSGPKRIDFAPSDLTAIFTGPHFAPGQPWSEDAWAMVIALFTGLRPSEAAQLQLDSIRHERGILCFVVEERTKNAGSRRFVPVHPKLIELGLERRIDELRRAGETHLFPTWHRQGMEAKAKAEAAALAKGGTPTTPLNEYFPRFVPKRFNVTYRMRVGIADDRKDFYSFRHTFKTGLARAGVDKATRDNITGHHDQSAGAVYVHDVSIEAMYRAVCSFQPDGFPL